MITKEDIASGVSEANKDEQQANKKRSYWQSICRHDFEYNTHFCGGSEYEVEKTCKICGLVEWDT